MLPPVDAVLPVCEPGLEAGFKLSNLQIARLTRRMEIVPS